MYPGTHARKNPKKLAVIVSDTGDSLTYEELEEHSVRLARALRSAGLNRGDHIALLSDNVPEVFVVLWAALRSGLYITAVNHHLAADEIAYIVNDCEARALIVSGSKGEQAEQILSSTPGVDLRLAYRGAVAGYDGFEEAIGRESAQPLADQPRGADMLYSSGTTGRPKGVKPPLPERQVHEPGDPFVSVFGPRFGFDENTVYYSPAPTYHAAPLRFGGVVTALGGTLVLSQKFDARESLRNIERFGVTHSQWVPTMFVRMLKLDREERESYDVSSVQVAIHAAAPCPVEVKQQMMDWWGPVLHEYYASTEGNGITLISPEEWLQHRGSVGKAGLGTIRICSNEGAELPMGEVGLVYFERETVPFEYYNDPAKTAEAQHPQHPTWTTTGDVGYLDEDGYLYLTDRKAFMIISGGVNIYPQEIENCLTLHPKVFDVAVIGVPDSEMGEQVKAVVQPADGVTGGPELADELISFVRERIAHYKAPRSVDFVDSLPRTSTGKLVKRALKDRYAAAPTS